MRRRTLLACCVVGVLVMGTVSEARVGGGRTFGNRGSRGFSYPSRSGPSQSYSTTNRTYTRPNAAPSYPQPTVQTPSVLKSLGAGLAGGFLGSMLFRSLGGGAGLGSYGMGSGGGFGILEFLLIAGL